MTSTSPASHEPQRRQVVLVRDQQRTPHGQPVEIAFSDRVENPWIAKNATHRFTHTFPPPAHTTPWTHNGSKQSQHQ